MKALKTNNNVEYKWFGDPMGTLYHLESDSFMIRDYYSGNEGNKYDLNGQFVKSFIIESDLRINFGLRVDDSWKRAEHYDGEDIHKVEYSNENMFPLVRKVNDQKCTDDRCRCENEEWYCGDTKLVRWNKHNMTVFILSKISDDSIITIYNNNECKYMDGDCGTLVWFKDGDILMSNSGDAPSVLFLKSQ